ncbi:MAG: NAD-dependent epimerase/dehydratase family protein [Candidatus Neomarinimicrobiota bacterium]
MNDGLKVIVLGATGMVGEGVLHECLKHPAVARVLVVNRRPCGVAHDKLTEIIHADFHDLSALEDRLAGYDACYFCLGVTSLLTKEADYRRVTYDLTMHVAETLVRLNPQMTFCYVSGAGTGSTKQRGSMWVRVKGETEAALLALPFKGAYMFRPGYIQPIRGLRNTYLFYKLVAPFYPLFSKLFPRFVCTLEDIGLTMIHVARVGGEKRLLECVDITELGEEERCVCVNTISIRIRILVRCSPSSPR